jgi:HEAT repeat protein
MKGLLTGFWLLGIIGVLLLLACLIFRDQPPGGRAFRSSPSVSTLIRALQAKDTRWNELEVAVWGQLPQFVQRHCQSLRPRLAVETRLEACTRLGRLGAKATNAVPCLIRALDDPDIMVRLGVIRTLGAIGPPARAAKGRLLAILHDPAHQKQTNRFVMADEIPTQAAITLADMAQHDPEIGSALLDLIGHRGTYGFPIHIALEWIAHTPEARSVFESVRKVLPQGDRSTWSLVHGLAQSYPAGKKRLAVLLSLAEDPDYGIRYQAVQELAALGPSAAGAVPKLMELFGATEREWEDLPENAHWARFQAYAAFVTGKRIGSVRAADLRAWFEASTAFAMEMRGSSARRYGPAPGARPVPVSPAAPIAAAPAPTPAPAAATRAFIQAYRLLGERRPVTDLLPGFNGLHHQVILALGEIGPPAREAIPLLAREYQDPTNSLRFEAAVARVRIDGNFPEVMPVLAAGLEQAAPDLRAALLSRLAQLASYDGAVTLLIKALADSDPEIRLQAFKSLARLGGKAAPALPVFIAALDDPESDIRHQALKNLGALGSNAAPALPALVKALGDPEWPVRSQAIVSLAALGDKAVPALPALRQMASDPSFFLRTLATNAVKTIESATHSSPGAHGPGPAR